MTLPNIFKVCHNHIKCEIVASCFLQTEADPIKNLYFENFENVRSVIYHL